LNELGHTIVPPSPLPFQGDAHTVLVTAPNHYTGVADPSHQRQSIGIFKTKKKLKLKNNWRKGWFLNPLPFVDHRPLGWIRTLSGKFIQMLIAYLCTIKWLKTSIATKLGVMFWHA